MRKVIQGLFALQMLLLPVYGATEPANCANCAGIVADVSHAPSLTVPILVQTSRATLPSATSFLAGLSAAQRASTTVVIELELEVSSDPLIQVETDAREIVEWGRANGPFDAMGLKVDGGGPDVQAYAIKRLSVLTQGLGLAKRIVAGPYTPEKLTELYQTGAEAYFDEVLTEAGSFDSIAVWLTEKDPIKKVSCRGLSCLPGECGTLG